MQAIWCLKFLEHDKIWGTICISVRPLHILGDSSLLSPRDLRPWSARYSVEQLLHVVESSQFAGNLHGITGREWTRVSPIGSVVPLKRLVIGRTGPLAAWLTAVWETASCAHLYRLEHAMSNLSARVTAEMIGLT